MWHLIRVFTVCHTYSYMYSTILKKISGFFEPSIMIRTACSHCIYSGCPVPPGMKIHRSTSYEQPVSWAPPWSVTSQLQSFAMARFPLTGSSLIVCLYKGKGDVLVRSNYHSLKLTKQVMKVLKRIVDGLLIQMVSINESQFGFIPGRGTTDAINSREVSSCQQETLHGFHRPEEGVWSSTWEGHLVGAQKTWCGGVDCATGAGDVCKCAEPCPCWWGVQWRI